jgi:hypothetical protein
LFALGEKLKDPLALPNLGAHLSDPGRFVGFNALVGLSNIAREGACPLSPGWTESDVAPKYRSASRGGKKGKTPNLDARPASTDTPCR